MDTTDAIPTSRYPVKLLYGCYEDLCRASSVVDTMRDIARVIRRISTEEVLDRPMDISSGPEIAI